jgi:membrane associated rhomboid family serine protease
MLRDTKRHQQRLLAVGKFTIIVCVFSFTNNVMMFLDFHRHTSSSITTTTDPTSSGCPPTTLGSGMTTERVRDDDGTGMAVRMMFLFMSFILSLRDTKRRQQRRLLAVSKFTIIICVFSFTNNMFLDYHRHTSSSSITTTNPTSSGCPLTTLGPG